MPMAWIDHVSELFLKRYRTHYKRLSVHLNNTFWNTKFRGIPGLSYSIACGKSMLHHSIKWPFSDGKLIDVLIVLEIVTNYIVSLIVPHRNGVPGWCDSFLYQTSSVENGTVPWSAGDPAARGPRRRSFATPADTRTMPAWERSGSTDDSGTPEYERLR